MIIELCRFCLCLVFAMIEWLLLDLIIYFYKKFGGKNLKKYYIRKNLIHIVNDTYDGSFTRVTSRTFNQWLQRSVGIVEIMHNGGFSEYFRNNSLVAYTTPLLTI